MLALKVDPGARSLNTLNLKSSSRKICLGTTPGTREKSPTAFSAGDFDIIEHHSWLYRCSKEAEAEIGYTLEPYMQSSDRDIISTSHDGVWVTVRRREHCVTINATAGVGPRCSGHRAASLFTMASSLLSLGFKSPIRFKSMLILRGGV